MTSKDNRPGGDAGRRLQAEAAVGKNGAQPPGEQEAPWPEAAQEVLHELRVHQIELQMQNEELRRSQRELDASHARYCELYDRAPVGYCSVGETGLIVQANLAAATLLGTTRDALLRQPITRFLIAEAQEGYYLLRKRLIETGEPQSCDLRMAKSNGTPFWAHLETTVAQGADGETEQRIALSDNPERERMQLELSESEDRFRAFMDALPAAAFIKDPDGATLYANRYMEEVLGARAWLGRTTRELFPPEMAEKMMADDRLALEAAAGAVVEEKVRGADGRLRVYQTHKFRIAQRGRPPLLGGIALDITERRHAELALSRSAESERRDLQGELRRAKDRLGAIASNMPGMMFELRQQGDESRFTYVSAGARELFGLATDGLPQALETLYSIIHEEDSEPFLQSLERSASTLSLWDWVGQVTGPRGELRWVQLRATPRAIEGGTILWEGIATDVTEAKSSELALNDTRQLLRVVSTDREAVREGERIRIARELHDELGQVLTGMKLHLSAMQQRIVPGDDALKTQAAYVMHQVDQAIAMTRSTVLDLRPPALDQGLGAAIAWLAGQFTRHSGIACSVNLPEAEIVLGELHAVALFRILQEALTNITRHAGASKASIDLGVRDGRLHLRVVDDGKGFVPTRVVAGRNFGLLGMRERVAMLGGRFEIKGADGVGTIISIEVDMQGGAT